MSTTPTTASDALFEEVWLPGPGGHNFYTRTYPAAVAPGGQPKAIVLFIHGFADHATRHERDHALWRARGITLFVYDQRGFGRTALDETHRSSDSAYGKTSARHTYEDMAWAISHVAEAYPGLPVFLMGYSAGGGYAAAFCAQSEYAGSVSKLAGVIALSPLLLLTHPPNTLLYHAVKVLSKVVPYATVSAPMPEERFSRDPAMADILRKDPLRKAQGTAKGLADMFVQCENLLQDNWRNWPKDLPLIVLHGTADEVNSCDATVKFFDKIEAKDKTLSLVEGAYHDMVNDTEETRKRVTNEYMLWVESHCPAREGAV